MQDTRLNQLLGRTAQQLTRVFLNPWRRLAFLFICLLFGFFLGTAVSTTTGQTADLDIVVAGIIVSICEVISWLTYGRPNRRPDQPSRSLVLDSLNVLKLGLLYGLVVEAFKLGS